MQRRKKTEEIIIHCAATRPEQNIDAREIDRWHRQRGWLKIGYHFVIKQDGTIEIGRNIDEVGAHARGHNSYSIGVCLVGGIDDLSQPSGDYSDEQWTMLRLLIDGLVKKYPGVKLLGHNDISSKACPSFNVVDWYGTS
mgnify:CR=1 FL=1